MKHIYFFLIFFALQFYKAQSDCISALTLCGNSSINYTPQGIGNINEVLGSCLDNEHHSVWYKFTIATSGTLTFDLTPTGPVDYDWAIFGPNKTCGNLGSAVRCNASGYTVATGMNMTNTNVSSGAGNTNPYCKYMDVVAGQTYYLFIDNWSATVYTFNLTWGGTATFVTPFTNPTTAPNAFIPPGVAGPTISSPREIHLCDNNTNFNFNSLTPGILNGNTNFTVNYISTASNAAAGINPLPSTYNVNYSTTYYYAITYNDTTNPNNAANNCRQTGSFIFKPGVTAAISASSNILCPGSSVTLNSANSTLNTWSTGATTQSITVNTPGTYTLTRNDGFCTSTPASVTISAATDPNLTISGNTSICNGTTTNLTATASGSGNTFLWNTGATTPTINVSTAGTYSVTVTTSQGCQFQKSVTVTTSAGPAVNNSTLSHCTTTSPAVFDLTSAQNSISTVPGVTFSYYQNLADANAQNGNFITNPTTFSSGTAVIYVVVKSGNCASIAQLQLNANQIPNPVITTSSTALCPGSTITLTSNYPTGNTWSTGATSQSITVDAPGTYSLTNNNGLCTSAPASVTINAATDPDLTITGNTAICVGTTTNLTANASGSGNMFLWNTGATTPTINVSTAGTYTVTVTTAQGCQYQKSVTVTSTAGPAVNNSTLSQCTSSSTAVFDLTSAQNSVSTVPGVTFSYYQNLADANAQNGNFITNPTVFSSGTAVIFVVVKSGNCASIAQLQLNANQIPNPVITAPSTTLCPGSTIILTSNYATGNTWSTGATTQSITVNSAGTYTLTNSANGCTSAPATITITNATDPNLQISGNLHFCTNGSTTLTATANGTGNTFSWSNGTVIATNTVSTAGLQTVTVTTAAGCQYQQSVTVIAYPIATTTIANPQNISCTNPQVTLNASASSFPTGSAIMWTATNGGNIVSGTNTLNPIINAGGTYTLTITSPANCSSQASVTVSGNTTPPVITLTATKTKICKGENVTLNAGGAQTYSWTGLTGTGNTQTVSPTVTTTYYVTGTGDNNCAASNTASITIEVVPAISSSLADVQICQGDTTILDAGSGPNYSYLWNTGATTQQISVQNAATYTVTISNGACSKIFSSVLSYIALPTINNITYNGDILTVYATGVNSQPLEYSIDGGVTWQDLNFFAGITKFRHVVVTVRQKGATCYTVEEYYTFLMPNVITPNQDGYNDSVDFTSMLDYKNFKAEVFDRYGMKVYSASKSTPRWNGTFNSRLLSTGTYWYVIEFTDKLSGKPVVQKGWILLKNR